MTQPLDAKFYGVIHKVKNGEVVPPDEFVVFLAKDDAFAAILPAKALHAKRQSLLKAMVASISDDARRAVEDAREVDNLKAGNA